MDEDRPIQKIAPSATQPLRPDLIEITIDNVEELFLYAPWDSAQVAVGSAVRAKLVEAAKEILQSIPRCPLRTRALNMLVDARMLANAAISFHGVVAEELK